MEKRNKEPNKKQKQQKKKKKKKRKKRKEKEKDTLRGMILTPHLSKRFSNTLTGRQLVDQDKFKYCMFRLPAARQHPAVLTKRKPPLFCIWTSSSLTAMLVKSR